MPLTENNESMDTSDHESTRCGLYLEHCLRTYIDINFFFVFVLCETHPWSLSKHSRHTLYSGLFSHRFQAIWYSELIYVLEHSHSYHSKAAKTYKMWSISSETSPVIPLGGGVGTRVSADMWPRVPFLTAQTTAWKSKAVPHQLWWNEHVYLCLDAFRAIKT
jgi:hypothetical protein